MHLWEVEHDYYCSESNYYQNGTGEKFATWSEFVRGYGDSDLDMNLVFRWDWEFPKDDEEKKILHPDPYYRDGNLMIFFMGQRKGKFWCVEVSVCKADEPEVIKFLQPRLDHLVKLWGPLSPIMDIAEQFEMSLSDECFCPKCGVEFIVEEAEEEDEGE